jgi:hypothetical protein
MSRFSSWLQFIGFISKHPVLAVVMLLTVPLPSRAQSATGSAGTTETNMVQLIQYGVDIVVAMSGCFAVYLGFRAARTLVASSREGGRGENKGTHVMADLMGAAIAVSISAVIYIVSNQIFGSSTTMPTLSAPSITPTTSGS